MGGKKPRTLPPSAWPPVAFKAVGSGLFAVRKPVGPTSNDIVQRLRSIVSLPLLVRMRPGMKVSRHKPILKVGHGGTLDPFAAGVLVIGVGGAATKKLGFLQNGCDKEYAAVAQLGAQVSSVDNGSTRSAEHSVLVCP